MLIFRNGEWVDITRSLTIEGEGEGTETGGGSTDNPPVTDQGGKDDGAAGGTDDQGVVKDDATKQQAKSDWRVEKYGPDYESNVDYWKDTASYWRGETDKEKKRRQGKAPIEDFDPNAAAKAAAATNGHQNGNGAAKPTTESAASKQEFETVQDLLAHINQQSEQIVTKTLEAKLGERDKENNFKTSMRKARTDYAGDPDKGFPSFAELEQDVLIPLIERNPKVLALLKEMDGDPGQNAYTLGIVLKSQNIDGLRAMFERKGREDFAEKIDKASKEAVRVKGGRTGPTSTKPTPEQIRDMPSDKFEEYVASQTGRV